MTLVYSALAATLVFTLYWFAVSKIGKKDQMGERVKRLAPDNSMNQENEVTTLTTDTNRSPTAKAIQSIMEGIGINVRAYRRANELRFYQAGIQSADTIVYFLFFKRILIFPIAIVAVLIMTIDVSGAMRLAAVMSGLLLLFIAILGPNMYLSNSRQKHQHVLTRSFPDTLDLLLVCVESGLALDGAMSRVCKELGRAHPEMTAELNRTRMELTLLNDRSQALQNLADRTDLVSFKSLVATLLQSEKFGTSLTDTLRVLSEDFRMNRLLAAENKAGRLPALMTIPLICFMLPAFFMIILGPAILQLVYITSGK
jgi:tight adherence protein C